MQSRVIIASIFSILFVSIHGEAFSAECADGGDCASGNGGQLVAGLPMAPDEAWPLTGRRKCYSHDAIDEAIDFVLCPDEFDASECSLRKLVSPDPVPYPHEPYADVLEAGHGVGVAAVSGAVAPPEPQSDVAPAVIEDDEDEVYLEEGC